MKPVRFFIITLSVVALLGTWTFQVIKAETGAADLTRLYTNGFELQSTDAGEEYTANVGTTPTISTSTKRTGAASMETTISSGTSGFEYDFATANTADDHYLRAYVRIADAPGGLTNILEFYDTGNTVAASIRLNSNLTLELWNDEDNAQIGSDSSALSTNTWYRIEIRQDTTDGAGSNDELEGRIDGISFASTTTADYANGSMTIRAGILTTATEATDIFFDDIAVNNDSGGKPNNWPQDGSVIYLRPNGNGTSTAWTNDCTNVDEINPDGDTSVITSSATNQNEDCTLDDATGQIGAADRIKLVQTNVRYKGGGTAGHNVIWSLFVSTDNDTTGSLTVSHSTYQNNNDESVAQNPAITSLNYPGTGTGHLDQWTIANLDAAFVRFGTGADNNPTTSVTAAWVVVEYVPATGGRLFTSGFELRDTTANMEWTAVTNTPTIDTTTKRSGDASLRANGWTSGTAEFLSYQFATANSNGPYFLRTYLYITTMPASGNTNRIASFRTSGAADMVYINLLGTGSVLQLFDEDGQVGSNSSALSTSTWYRIEVKIDASGAGSTDIVEAKIDGASAFATSSTRNLSSGVDRIVVGGNLGAAAITAGDWYFDDIALNQNFGSVQNSYPGSGAVVMMQPDATGDNSAWTNDYTTIDETPPPNTSDFISSTTVGQIEDVNLESSTTAGITTGSTINVVNAGVRFNSTGTLLSGFKLRLNDVSGGAAIESDQIRANSTTWFTNSPGTLKTYPLIAYSLPGDNTSWTMTTLDSAQIGVRNVTDTTDTQQVTALWLMVDYTPPPPVRVQGVVYKANESTVATSGANGGPCDGSTVVVSIRVNGGTAATGTCNASTAAYDITTSSGVVSGDRIAVYLTSTMKANTIFVSNAADVTGIDLYEDRVAVTYQTGSSITVANMTDYDDDQNATDMLFDADTGAPDTLSVNSGVEMHIPTSKTFAPGGDVTTPKLHVVGTYTGASETLTLNGTGTGASRPLYINGGTFTASSNVTKFTGAGATDIEITTYNTLQLQPTSGTETYTWLSGSPTINGDLTVNNGATLTVDLTTNDPALTIKGNLTLNTGTTWQKPASIIIWSPTGTKTWTDNVSTTQDIGRIQIGSGSSTPTISLGTSVKATSIDVASSHTLDVNGTKTITLTKTATAGTAFSISGTFSESTGTVEFTGDTVSTFTQTLNANNSESSTFNNLTLSPSITNSQTYQFGTTSLSVNGDFTINPTASSTTKTLTVNLGAASTVASSKTTTLQGSGTGVGKLDTTSGSSYSFSTGKLNIAAGGNFTANGSSVTITGTTATLVTLNGSGDLVAGTSTFAINGDASINPVFSGTFTGSDSFNNMTIGPQIGANLERVYTLGSGALNFNGDLSISPQRVTPGEGTMLVNMGAAITVATGKTLSVQAGGLDPAPTNLDTISGSNYSITTGALVVGSNGTLTAQSSIITLTSTTGTLMDVAGSFVEGDSDVRVTSASGSPTLLAAAETFHILTINAAATVINAGGNITTDNDAGNKLYIQTGVFNQENRTITPGTSSTLEISSTGTLCLGGTTTATNATCDNSATQTTAQAMPAFTTFTLNADSTVRYLSDATTTVSRLGGASYGNLYLGPTLTAGRTYSTQSGGTLNIAGNFTIDPDAASALLLTVNAEGAITVAVSKTTTITRTGTNATSKLDLRPATSDFDLTSGKIDIQTGGTLDIIGTSSATLITLNATSGTLLTKVGTFDISSSTATVTMNPDANVTLTSNNSVSFPYLNLTPTITDNRTYTFGTGSIFVQRDLMLNPTAASSFTLTVTLGNQMLISDNATIQGTTSGIGKLDTGSNQTLSVGDFLTVGAGGNLTANASSVLLLGATGPLFTLNASGDFVAGTSTVGLGANATVDPIFSGSFTGSDAVYNFSITTTISTSSKTYTLGSSAIEFNGDVTINPTAASALSLTVNLGANVTIATGKTLTVTGTGAGPATSVLDLSPSTSNYNLTAGHVDIQANGTLTANGGTSTIDINGNLTRAGTFTAANSTTLLSGSSAQTVNSAMTGANAFYNLTISNNSGSSASDCERTGFSASVDFADDVEATNMYTITTANVRVEYDDGNSYTFNDVNWNGQASGSRIFFRNSAASGSWALNVASGPPQTAVSYVNVSRSDATTGGQAEIAAYDGTNVDCNNNPGWIFVNTITISGTCDQYDQTTDCTDDGGNQIAVAVNGSLQGQVDTVVDGAWQITGVSPPATGDIVTIFIDGEATDDEEAVAVLKYDGTSNITGVVLYWRHLTIGSGDNQTLANADIDAYDNSVSADEDIFFDVSAGDDLTVDSLTSYSDEELYIVASNVYRPASGGGGDVNTTHLENDGTITADSNAINVFGNWQNDSTFTAGTSTTTFTSTSTGRTLAGTMTGASGKFNNLVFNGVAGAWTFNAAVEVGNDFTVTNGAVTANGNNLTVTRDFTLANTSGVSYVAGTTTVTVSRHYNDVGGKFSAGSSTLTLNGTGTMDILSDFAFYNLNVAYSSFTTTMDGSVNTKVSNDMTLNGGTMTGTSSTVQFIQSATNTPLTFNSATTLNGTSNIIYYGAGASSITVTAAGADYGNWQIWWIYNTGANNVTHNFGGNITTTAATRICSGSPTGGTLNTQNFSFTASSFKMGASGCTVTVSANFGSSAVSLTSTTDALLPESTGGSYNLDLSSSTVDTKGNVKFVDTSGSIAVTPGTSLLKWTHTSGTKTYAPNGQSLYNLQLDGTGGTVSPNAAVDVNNNFTITNGTYDTVNGSNYGLTIGGNYSNSGTFTARNANVTFDATDAGNTIQGTLSGGSAFYDLTFNGSGGEWTPNAAVAVTNNLTMTAGTLLGTQNVTVNANVQGTNGIINLTGGTFEQRTNDTARNFGTTSGSAAWTFNDLTFSDSCSGICTGGNITITTQTGGSGGITVSGVMRISKSGDQEGVDLSAGNRTWTISGTGGDPFQVIASPAGDLIPATSTFTYTGNNAGGDTTVQSETYNNLIVNNGSEIYNLEGTTQGVDVTVTAGELKLNSQTLAATDDLTVDGTLSGTTNVTVNGHVQGTGTINLTGGTFKQGLLTGGLNKNFGTTSGSTNWTFNDLTFANDCSICAGATVTTQTGATGGVTVTGILRVGESGDGQVTSLNAGNRTWTLSGTGGDPFQLLASPAGDLSPSTSTFTYTGNNGGGATTIQSETYNNLIVNNGSETYNLEGATLGADVTVTAGTLALNGQTLNASNDLTVNGTLSGSTNVTVNGSAIGSGTINLSGGTFTQRITANGNETFGSTSGSNDWTFSALTFRNSDTNNHSITANSTGSGQFIVTGNITFGSLSDTNTVTLDFDTNDRILNVDGSVDITSLGVLEPSSSASFTVGDNWTNSGTFNHNNGTVTFDTTTTATFAGATTFYNFTSTTAAKTLEFTSGQTFTIDTGGLLTLTGTADPNEIQIKSTTPTSQWFINHQGTESVSYVQVIDSGCDVASTQITTSNSVNDGNNGTCWLFGSTYEQADYRFGYDPEDTSTDSDYAGAPAENTAWPTTGTGTAFRLRMLLHIGGSNLAQNGETFKLQFGEKTGATCTSGVSWGDVATGSGVIRYQDGPPADGDNITSVAGDPDHAGHTKQYQDYEEANNFTNSVSAINSGQDGVWSFALLNHSAIAGKRYCFKAVKSTGTDLDTYTFYPEVIIEEELVASLDSTSKNFGVVSPGGNPTNVSSTLTTSTNSSTGYVIYAWSTQLMTMGSFTVPDWTGTNSSPTLFSNGSFGFGYSTNDITLTGGTADRFDPGGGGAPRYAGFSHSGPGDPVADRTSGPVTAATDTVTYRFAGSGTQAAGTYNTVIVYVWSVTF